MVMWGGGGGLYICTYPLKVQAYPPRYRSSAIKVLGLGVYVCVCVGGGGGGPLYVSTITFKPAILHANY